MNSKRHLAQGLREAFILKAFIWLSAHQEPWNLTHKSLLPRCLDLLASPDQHPPLTIICNLWVHCMYPFTFWSFPMSRPRQTFSSLVIKTRTSPYLHFSSCSALSQCLERCPCPPVTKQDRDLNTCFMLSMSPSEMNQGVHILISGH